LHAYKRIFEKTHKSSISIHPGATKRCYEEYKRFEENVLVVWDEESSGGVCCTFSSVSEQKLNI